MSEKQAQDSAAETEWPDRPRGARVVRNLWIPAVVALAGTLGYAGTAMWADELGVARGLPLGHAVADTGRSEAHYAAAQGSASEDAALASLEVVTVTGVPGGFLVEVYGAPVPKPKPHLAGKGSGRLSAWQGQRRGRDA